MATFAEAKKRMKNTELSRTHLFIPIAVELVWAIDVGIPAGTGACVMSMTKRPVLSPDSAAGRTRATAAGR